MMATLRNILRQPRATIAACALLFILLLLWFRSVYRYAAFETGPASLDHILNSTLGFQKIFVINLRSRPDHRDSMSLAAALTGLEIEYVDGATDIDNKTLPPYAADARLSPGALGNWRAHTTIARIIVEQGITSALVLEDDADWDVRIKRQMRDFAGASRLLVQPLQGTKHSFADPTNPRISNADEAVTLSSEAGQLLAPSSSPYGDIDRWDILWVGHCGSRFPQPSDDHLPLGRTALLNDETVPEPQHIEMQFGDAEELKRAYPAHTRVVSRAAENVCTLAYAISLPGARRLLYEFSVHKLTSSTDIMLRQVCDGLAGRKMRTCLSVQPQLFQHHRPVGAKSSQSDISPHPDEYNAVAFTKNIRWSTRVNFDSLVDGDGNLIDQFPDGAEKKDYGF